jgi:hypothetical protein
LPLRDWHRQSSSIGLWWVAVALRLCSGFLIVSPKFPNHRDSGCDRADKRETDREYWQHGDFARAIRSTKTVNAVVCNASISGRSDPVRPEKSEMHAARSVMGSAEPQSVLTCLYIKALR